MTPLTSTKVFMVAVNSARTVFVYNFDFSLLKATKQAAKETSKFSFSTSSQLVGAFTALKSGSPVEVFVYGSRKVGVGSASFFASFVQNTLGSVFERQSSFFGQQSEQSWTSLVTSDSIVSSPAIAAAATGLIELPRMDLVWQAEKFLQKEFSDWEGCASCTPDSNFVAWNTPPSLLTPIPEVIGIDLGKSFQFKLQCPVGSGCLFDKEADYPVYMAGTLSFPGFKETYVIYNPDEARLYTLETFNEQYVGLSGSLNLVLIDSQGMRTEMKAISMIAVVVDLSVFDQALRTSTNHKALIESLKAQLVATNNAKIISDKLAAGEQVDSCKAKTMTETISKGNIALDFEKTFGASLETSKSSVSTTGKLSIAFSRPVLFP